MDRKESSRNNIKKAILSRKKIGVEKTVEKVVSMFQDDELRPHVTDCFSSHGVSISKHK